MRSSIRRRLTVAFIALTISPLLLVGVILSWQSFTTQRQQALNLQREVAQRVSTQVTAFLQGVENELLFTSQIPGLLKLDRDEQYVILSKLIAYHDVFEELALLDSQGQEAVRATRLSITSRLGSRAEAAEFITPHTSGQTYYSLVWFDETNGEPFMTIAVPLFDARTGQVDAVLVSDVRIKKIWDLIATLQLGPGQNVYIVDAQGKVVAHRNPSVVLRGTTFYAPDQDGIQPGLASVNPVLAVDTHEGSPVQALVARLTSPNVVMAVDTVRFGEQEFNIIVEQAVAEALALAISAILVTACLMVAVLVMSGLLGLVIVRQLVQPIQSMARTAQAISAGDLSQQVEVSSRDELGLLADAFNGMTVQLRSLIDGLEQRVAERTAQLEAANKELEAFSYSISHDLRAPLRAMNGFSRILMEDHASELSPDLAHKLEVIRENAQYMGCLVDDLLAFSRLSRRSLDRQAVAMTDLVRQALDGLSGEQAGRQVELVLGALPPCQGDPVLLRQVWFNLLSNALKFTRGRQAARIEVGSVEKDETQVYFVKDNGTGFDMQYAGKLFGVFQRLHRAEEYEGTGVGLAIVQRIVARHGGRVWVEAEVDQGATFYFTI